MYYIPSTVTGEYTRFTTALRFSGFKSGRDKIIFAGNTLGGFEDFAMFEWLKTHKNDYFLCWGPVEWRLKEILRGRVEPIYKELCLISNLTKYEYYSHPEIFKDDLKNDAIFAPILEVLEDSAHAGLTYNSAVSWNGLTKNRDPQTSIFSNAAPITSITGKDFYNKHKIEFIKTNVLSRKIFLEALKNEN